MPDPRQGRAWQALRQQVLERDGHQCAECGTAGNEDNPLQVDHITPVAAGGAGMDIDNLQVLCRKHNLLKSAKVQPKRVTWYDKTWLDNIE